MRATSLHRNFFERDALTIAPELLGKTIIRYFQNNSVISVKITELEVYGGEEDLACHVSRGKTKRNRIMYEQAGLIYVYLVYGMHWMLNIVVNSPGYPQAILIRGLDIIQGPGRLTKKLGIDGSFYGEDICTSSQLYLLNDPNVKNYIQKPRIGIDYAGEYWKNQPWRFLINSSGHS